MNYIKRFSQFSDSLTEGNKSSFDDFDIDSLKEMLEDIFIPIETDYDIRSYYGDLPGGHYGLVISIDRKDSDHISVDSDLIEIVCDIVRYCGLNLGSGTKNGEEIEVDPDFIWRVRSLYWTRFGGLEETGVYPDWVKDSPTMVIDDTLSDKLDSSLWEGTVEMVRIEFISKL